MPRQKVTLIGRHLKTFIFLERDGTLGICMNDTPGGALLTREEAVALFQFFHRRDVAALMVRIWHEHLAAQGPDVRKIMQMIRAVSPLPPLPANQWPPTPAEPPAEHQAA